MARFTPGRSGNPTGRKKGSVNKATAAAQAILDGEAEALTRKAIEMALGGDGQAMRLCLERLIPVRKDRPIQFDLPSIDTAADLPRVAKAILEGAAAGHITPAEAAALNELIGGVSKSIELHELAADVAKLKAAADADRS